MQILFLKTAGIQNELWSISQWFIVLAAKGWIKTFWYIEAKDDDIGGDNWSYKSCKAPVKSSPLTDQHQVFFQAGCPSCQPTNNVKALKGKIK